ncbi:MAG TPA: CBM35 domain-containing protein [Oligoflexus sp.]|uniref:CBM35 domain-containing protein n=1 Tax=Oligoflexus sp. TaxID=1971216 RepID=UPI002D396B95|nr:CBM35 domain-containing protein [Oligoflexus sp.]HYX36279.1 CBM35 domain-containing protein [Oligoflexus sp.]
MGEWGHQAQTWGKAERSGFWGDGYVTGFEVAGSAWELPFCVPESGSYEMTLRYASPYGDKVNSVYLNGQKLNRLNFLQSSNFIEKKVPLTLTRGQNNVMLRMDSDDWGWIDLDAMWLERR